MPWTRAVLPAALIVAFACSAVATPAVAAPSMVAKINEVPPSARGAGSPLLEEPRAIFDAVQPSPDADRLFRTRLTYLGQPALLSTGRVPGQEQRLALAAIARGAQLASLARA